MFISTRVQPWSAVSLEAGLRWDFQDYGQTYDDQLSPRLSALFRLSDHTKLRLSAGRFFQPEGIHEMRVMDGLNEYQQAQYADHYIAGLEHHFGESGASIRIEAFSKRFQDPAKRFENALNPFVLLPELASDRIEIAPTRARADGIESTIRYSPHEKLNVWLSYTHSNVEDKLDGEWFSRAWDQRHTISSGAIWNPGNWSFGASVLWHSGWRTTALPPFVPEDTVPALDYNGETLPDFFTVDLRAAYTWVWPRHTLTAFLEVTNASNRENVGAFEYDVEEVDGGYELSREPEHLIPIVPSIGIRWQFTR